jgi:hypothetical protein
MPIGVNADVKKGGEHINSEPTSEYALNSMCKN